VEPPILNHSILLEEGVLGSNEEIPQAVRSRAQAQHLRLRRALERLSANDRQEELEQVLVRTADLLYIIRSNLMHGEKFAGVHGRRIARDRIIAATAIRVLTLFFDLTFDLRGALTRFRFGWAGFGP
jgi:predicted nucleic acid-binding protein